MMLVMKLDLDKDVSFTENKVLNSTGSKVVARTDRQTDTHTHTHTHTHRCN